MEKAEPKHPSVIRAWIEAMRLRTLPVSIAGVTAGIAYSLIDQGRLLAAPAVICLFFAIAAQISSNFANEYFDYRDGLDKAGREGPRRGVTEGDITPKAMLTAAVLTLGIAAAAGLSLIIWGGWILLLPGVLIILGAFAYSCGPWPLSRHAMGEAAVIIFFGLAPVCLTYYLQTATVTGKVALGGLAFGLMGANVLMSNNIRDIPDDRTVGKTTLATILGHNAAAWLYIAIGVGAAVSLYFSAPENKAVLAASIWYFAASSVCGTRIFRLRGRKLTAILAQSSLAMFAASLILLAA